MPIPYSILINTEKLFNYIWHISSFMYTFRVADAVLIIVLMILSLPVGQSRDYACPSEAFQNNMGKYIIHVQVCGYGRYTRSVLCLLNTLATPCALVSTAEMINTSGTEEIGVVNLRIDDVFTNISSKQNCKIIHLHYLITLNVSTSQHSC